MRISRRTSGGRGEYEISGELPGGEQPRDLLGRIICLDLGLGQIINTGVTLKEQGGKMRLRKEDALMQVPRQVAAVLLLPDPVRADEALGAGAPVIQRNRYAIEHLMVNRALSIPPNLAVLRIPSITVVNRSYQGEEVSVVERAAQLRNVWQESDKFPVEIADLLSDHHQQVERSQMIGPPAESLVSALQRSVSERSSDLGILYSEAGDVLPALTEALHLEIPHRCWDSRT